MCRVALQHRESLSDDRFPLPDSTNDTFSGQGGQDLLAGNEGADTLNDANAVIDEAFVLPASVLTALEA